MKTFTPLCLFFATATLALANTAPTVVIQSAQMRPGTTLMDVVFRVNDPDDATVKTRALAFVDGVRSFAKVIRPVTFVEGTAAKLGDAIAANTDHTLTWDVATDWNVALGQVKFEVLAMDGRGLLPLDWVTIPAAGGKPAVTVSKNSPTNTEVLNALFWLYASGDPGLSLSGGVLTGNSSTGVFNRVVLSKGYSFSDQSNLSDPYAIFKRPVESYATPFIFKRMNLDPDDEIVSSAARAGFEIPYSPVFGYLEGWHSTNRPYAGLKILKTWLRPIGPYGVDPSLELPTIPNVEAIAAYGDNVIALTSKGTVVPLRTFSNLPAIPAGLTGVVAIAAGNSHALALKSDGTIVAWGQSTIPAGLSGVTAIAAGAWHSLALKSDGTVVAWGYNGSGQTVIPSGLTGVTAISAGYSQSMALKNDGTVVAWGSNNFGESTIPSGLTGVTAISTTGSHCLALKSDGTVVGWGSNQYGETTIPAGLVGVATVMARSNSSYAVKSDGSLVGWGLNNEGQISNLSQESGVTNIVEVFGNLLALKAKGL